MPIAIWCLLVAGLLPIMSVAIAKWGTTLDNNHPRDWAQALEGYRRRAYAAHQNAYEFFPFYAAAIIVAWQGGSDAGTLDLLAVMVIAFRLAYVSLYVADLATPRSIAWSFAFFGTIAIFTAPAWS